MVAHPPDLRTGITPVTIENLRAALRGTVVARDDANYDFAREGLLFNRCRPDRRPALIVRAADAADVQSVVRYAASTGTPVSVRGSGHNWSGIALQDGIVLDVSAIDGVSVDREARIAEVGPGVTNRVLARILTENGFAFPLGHCGTVAVSGYLLGGGFGWNSGAWGMAAFNVDSVDVVTADGELRRASETENSDIFWAVRGGGPAFFGVVTRFRLRLRTLPRAITTSVRTYPLSRVAEVERWMTETMRAGPANVEFTAAMTSAPPPMSDAGKVVSAIATVFAETEAEAARVLAEIAATAPADALDAQPGMPTPFDTLYDIIAQFFPEGARYAADAFWSDSPGELFSGLADGVGGSVSAASFALGVVMPPATPAAPEAALSMSGRAFGAVYAIWKDPKDDDRNRTWLRATADAVAPITRGHYVGEADLERPGRMAASFDPAAWDRLAALRRRFDPAGVFASAARRSSARAA
jgi:FAD/FMN-containing dehydrogenase